jgi:hypothetical protein
MPVPLKRSHPIGAVPTLRHQKGDARCHVTYWRRADSEAHTRAMWRVVAGGILVTLALAAGTAGASRSGTPALTVVERSPVVIRGVGFGRRERVVVTVSAALQRATKRTVATSQGRFVIRFDGMRLSPCTGASIVATGARGHWVRLKFGLRECPGPALEP